MAPELFSANQLANERIDVYAFGIVLNELVTRDWAFCELEDSEIRAAVLKEQRPEQAEWAPDELNKLIQKCWHQDPAKRPTSTALITLIKALPHGTWREPPNAN
jgi:serine/threonine protein kinase